MNIFKEQSRQREQARRTIGVISDIIYLSMTPEEGKRFGERVDEKLRDRRWCGDNRVNEVACDEKMAKEYITGLLFYEGLRGIK